MSAPVVEVHLLGGLGLEAQSSGMQRIVKASHAAFPPMFANPKRF